MASAGGKMDFVNFKYTFNDGKSGEFEGEKVFYDAVMAQNPEAIVTLRRLFDQSPLNEPTVTEPEPILGVFGDQDSPPSTPSTSQPPISQTKVSKSGHSSSHPSTKPTQPEPSTSKMPGKEEGEEKKVQWNQAGVLLLLQLWEQHQESFSSPKTKKKTIWQKIARLLSEAGYVVTWAQAENKWKNLTKKYRDVVDHNNTSGNNKKTCAFFNELSDIYGYKPNVNPIVTASTLQPVSKPSTKPTTSTPKPERKRGDSDESEVENDENDDISIISNNSHSNTKNKTKKRPKTNSQEMIDCVTNIHEEQMKAEEKREENRLKLVEKMHKEKMESFAEFLTILKENFKK